MKRFTLVLFLVLGFSANYAFADAALAPNRPGSLQELVDATGSETTGSIDPKQCPACMANCTLGTEGTGCQLKGGSQPSYAAGIINGKASDTNSTE